MRIGMSRIGTSGTLYNDKEVKGAERTRGSTYLEFTYICICNSGRCESRGGESGCVVVLV